MYRVKISQFPWGGGIKKLSHKIIKFKSKKLKISILEVNIEHIINISLLLINEYNFLCDAICMNRWILYHSFRWCIWVGNWKCCFKMTYFCFKTNCFIQCMKDFYIMFKPVCNHAITKSNIFSLWTMNKKCSLKGSHW